MEKLLILKKKKIEERKKNLKDNLNKLKELQTQKDNLLTGENIFDLGEQIEKNENEFVYGTPPSETINLEEEILKMNNIQEEYKKLYKKSIVMKDYYIRDWIQILELLGLPVIKAEGEADPLCAYMLKNNLNIYGIISDDSDMLVFGSPILMRKSINQQFIIIELEKILTSIEILLSNKFKKYISFDINNLVDFSILLGTDYETFKLNKSYSDSYDMLCDYVLNDMDYTKLISTSQHEKFEIIKKYYTEYDYEQKCGKLLNKPVWNKPNFLDLKKRLLELNVDEEYIDKNNHFLDICYNKINKKNGFKNDTGHKKIRSNSFESNNYYYANKYRNKNYMGFNSNFNTNENMVGFFKRQKKNNVVYPDKNLTMSTDVNKEITSTNNNFEETNLLSELDEKESEPESELESEPESEERESIVSNKNDTDDIFDFGEIF